MAKLVKQCRYDRNGKKLINSYHANISKSILNQTNIKDTDEIIIYTKDNKIIIEKGK